jgi:hypothetical protein
MSEETETKDEAPAPEKRVDKRIMTPGHRYHMAGLLPFGKDEVAEFTPEAFRDLPREDQPVFTLRSYARKDVSAFQAALMGDADVVEAAAAALKSSGLVGWRNLKTQKGAEVPFSDEAVDALPGYLVMSLHTECMAYATGLLPEEELGLRS